MTPTAITPVNSIAVARIGWALTAGGWRLLLANIEALDEEARDPAVRALPGTPE
jgi:hypothetical protein